MDTTFVTEDRLLTVLADQERRFMRYTGALSEDFKSQLQGLAEVVEHLMFKMDNFTVVLDQNTDAIREFKIEMRSIDCRIEKLEEKKKNRIR